MGQFLALAGPIISMMGASANAAAAKKLGLEGKAMKDYEADVTERQGVTKLARATHAALNEARRTKMVASRFLAVSAFNGSSSDPKTIRLAGDLENEGAYRRAMVVWGGLEEKRQADQSAKLSRMEGELIKKGGKAKARAYQMEALAHAAQGASTLYQKYASSGVTTTPGSVSGGASFDVFGDNDEYFMANT